MFPHNVEAERMTRTQLERRDIRDPRIREVMSRLPRHLFVPGAGEVDSYGDHPVPIGHGQTISQPYMVAIMTQELELRGGERVLEIGTGSGYQTAVLAALGAEVYTIERIEELQTTARATLAALGFTSIHYRQGDGSMGWVEHAPFHRVIVTAASPSIPPVLRLQLSDGGILVAPVGEIDGYQRLATLRKNGETFSTRLGVGCRFVPLVTSPDPQGDRAP